MKICAKCKESKDLSAFTKNAHRLDGLSHYCKPCAKLDRQNRYRRDPGKFKVRYQAWLATPKGREWTKDYYRQLKFDALGAYSGGNPRCACCGESHIEFLSIDHINGNGSEHRRGIRKSIYKWLRDNGYPDGFRVLCMNCNFASGKFGYCPHAHTQGDRKKKWLQL